MKEDRMDSLMLHYNKGTQDMDTRRTRKNGWNEIVNAYMGKLPANWPFLSTIVDPRIRTTIIEKTSRLLNAKLQGRLIPREGGDITKARINNAILDFQWDNATNGGPMIEKIAQVDQTCRLFGAGFAMVYFDTVKNTNEIKPWDQRDLFFDGGATHIRNAKWLQAREFSSFDVLEARGYDVKKGRAMAKKGEIINDLQSTKYESQVKANRGLENRVGEFDDPINPVVEVVTEWTPKKCTIFLPRYGLMLSEGPNPYKHGLIPFAQLRYYPLGDDIYGESEVESVLPLSRTLNALLSATLDEIMIQQRPPLKIIPTGTRRETIEYGPGAQWIMNNINNVQEMQFSGQVVQNFNAMFPALVSAYNTAMGDQSLGVSNTSGSFSDKTATEVKALSQQQNNRDQYNQIYLGEFLKDLMLMWLSNNKQYLFDDPTKKYMIVKIIGKENIQALQQMQLDSQDIPDDAMRQIAGTVMENPAGVTDQQLNEITSDVSVPSNPVVTNPDETDPTQYEIKNKLSVADNGQEAELYVTPEDFDGDFDYIPDVSSMAAGAGQMMKEARQHAIDLAINPAVGQMLMTQGEKIKIKDLLVGAFEDGGIKDAEALFESLQNGQPQPGGPTGPQAGPGSIINPGQPGMGAGAPPIPPQSVPGGIPQPQGF